MTRRSCANQYEYNKPIHSLLLYCSVCLRGFFSSTYVHTLKTNTCSMHFLCTGQLFTIFCFLWFHLALGITQGACRAHNILACGSCLECFSLFNYITRTFCDMNTSILLPLVHEPDRVVPVSYTHLTLPTIYSV